MRALGAFRGGHWGVVTRAGLLACLLLQSSLGLPQGAAPQAASSVSGEEGKNHFWSVTYSGERYSFKAGDGFGFTGNSGLVSLGYGYLHRRWFAAAMTDLIIGPFNPSPNQELELDYQGTGVKAWWGYSAQELDLRHPEGGYGFVLGVSYADFTGHSLGNNRREPEDPQSLAQLGLRHTYALRVANMAVMPGIFFCWLEPLRMHGHKPSQLITRIEGYMLTIAFSFPLFSTYQASYWERTVKEEYRDQVSAGFPAGVPPAFWDDKPQRAKGSLDGYTILFSFSTLLGS